MQGPHCLQDADPHLCKIPMQSEPQAQQDPNILRIPSIFRTPSHTGILGHGGLGICRICKHLPLSRICRIPSAKRALVQCHPQIQPLPTYL